MLQLRVRVTAAVPIALLVKIAGLAQSDCPHGAMAKAYRLPWLAENRGTSRANVPSRRRTAVVVAVVEAVVEAAAATTAGASLARYVFSSR